MTSEQWFPVRVGKGRIVHAAMTRPYGSLVMTETACGFRDVQGWIARCDLEPITCRSPKCRQAANSPATCDACGDLMTGYDLDGQWCDKHNGREAELDYAEMLA